MQIYLQFLLIMRKKLHFFAQKASKKYIYTKYIYSKCTIFAFFGFYPMGILWE